MSSALGSRRYPAPPPTEPHPPAPEPILMRPLCCMKMVSLVRFPWMMGGLQACRKLQAMGGKSGRNRVRGRGGVAGRGRASPGSHLSADRICVHHRFQAWCRTHSVGPAGRGGWACGAPPRLRPGPTPKTRGAPPRPISNADGAPSCPVLDPAPAHSPYPGVHGLVVLLGLFEELLEAARRHVLCDEDDLRGGRARGLRQLRVGAHGRPAH